MLVSSTNARARPIVRYAAPCVAPAAQVRFLGRDQSKCASASGRVPDPSRPEPVTVGRSEVQKLASKVEGALRQRALRAGQAEHGIETVDPFRHRLARGNETCDRSRQLGWANRVDELVGMTPGGEDPAQDLAQGRSVRQLGIWRQELSQSGGLAAQIRNDRPQLGFAHPLSDLAPELEGARRVDYRTGDHCPIASVGRHEGERPQVGNRLHGRSGS